MIDISNSTSKDNPPWRLAEPIGLTPSARPARPRAPGRWLAAITRRLGDRLFAMNDTEAYWRGWQITKTQGGLGRSYRDPRFGTLAECPKCRGVGVTAELSCLPCLGMGRQTRGEVS